MEGRSWTWKASFVAVRIAAVYLVVQAVVVFGTQLALLVVGNPSSLRWWLIAGIIAIAFGGVILWFAAERIAFHISTRADEQDVLPEGSEPPVHARPLISLPVALSTGLTILGIVIFVDGLAGLSLVIGELVQSTFTPGSRFYALASVVIRLVAGAWLIFGVHDIVGWFSRIRNPYPKQPSD